MPDSVIFSAGTDRVEMSNGNAVVNGAVTMVAICKPTGATLDAFYHWMFWFGSSGGGFGIVNSQLRTYDGGSEPNSSFTIPALDEWYLIAVSKATGSIEPRFHLYRYSNSNWQHSIGSGVQNNFSLGSEIQFPFASGEYFIGNVLIAGIWASELSDGAIEGLISGTQAWRNAAPSESWRFNTSSNTSALTGVSWQRNAPTATLDTGDAPAGWSDTLTAGIQHLGACGFSYQAVSTNTLLLTTKRNITAGEQLILALACHTVFAADDEPIVSISDGTANSYSRLYSTEMTNIHDIWFCTTVASVAAGTTITITLAATSAQWRLCRLDAYQGLAASPFDQGTSQLLTSSVVVDSGFTATTTQADELIYGLMACSGSTYILPAADIRVRQFDFAGMNAVSSDRIVSATGTYKANATLETTVTTAEATVLTLKGAATEPALTYQLPAQNVTPLAWRS